jgi:hypothetical protein
MSIATARHVDDQRSELAGYSLLATRYPLLHGGAPL